MEETTIVLTLGGYGDKIPARAFVTAVQSFLNLLQDLDSAISEDRRGTVEWEISMLSKNSPAQIGYTGRSKLQDRSNVRSIGRECVHGIQTLRERADRTRIYSDAALEKTNRLANLTRRQFSRIVVQADSEDAPVTRQVFESIKALTAETAQEEGSVVGNLDSINVHKGNEFRVWDEITKKPVRCRFPLELFAKAQSNLKRRVLISGMLKMNRLGNIVSVSVGDIEPQLADNELPTIKRMSGAVKGITGGLSLREYMKVLRDEE